MKRISVWLLASVLVSVLSFTLFSSYRDNAQAQVDNATIYRQLDLFGEVFERIREIYVDAPDEKALIENAIDGMLTGLDPHSDYLTAEEFMRTQNDVLGEFGGLGIQFILEEGVVKVLTTVDDTPADRAGILGGDFITHIDGQAVKGLSVQEAVSKMRGAVGTPIKLKLFRPVGDGKSFEVDIIRALIEDNPVRSTIEEKVIYVRVSQFNAKAAEKVREAVVEGFETVSLDDLQGVILDLRNNGGGILNQAVDISDFFLSQGEIVTTRGREASQIQRYAATDGDLIAQKPLVVLINGGSASASEIVAGALQDHHRATLLGTRSFGKGSVQRIIPLDQGESGAIRITTGRYYTPSGRSIQAKGIDPDIVVDQPLPDDLTADQVTIAGEVSLTGHLEASDDADAGNATDEKKESDKEAKEDEDGPKPPVDEEAEAALAAKIAAEKEKAKGSPAYVPREKEDDMQLQFALKLLRGEETDENFPAKSSDKTQ